MDGALRRAAVRFREAGFSTEPMSRSTLTVSQEHKTAFDSFKRDDESVNEAFSRLLDAASGELPTPPPDADVADAIAECNNRLDEIASTLPKQTADEVENRLTRR